VLSLAQHDGIAFAGTHLIVDIWEASRIDDERVAERALRMAAEAAGATLLLKKPTFGTVLALDGVVQLTECDNHIYHEMIAYVPLMAHEGAKDVLIIGGTTVAL
jgi:spermidine synthase